MVKNREINGAEEIGLVTPTPDYLHRVLRIYTHSSFNKVIFILRSPLAATTGEISQFKLFITV